MIKMIAKELDEKKCIQYAMGKEAYNFHETTKLVPITMNTSKSELLEHERLHLHDIYTLWICTIY